jgi:hypothetical protein
MQSNKRSDSHEDRVNEVDMSSEAITSRLREVSELYELGISLAKAKPISQSKEDTTPASPSTMDDENAGAPPN